MVRSFLGNPHFYNELNILRAEISCVLESCVGVAARSTQPVTLYLSVNITPSNLPNSPPSIPTKDDDSPTRRIQFPSPEPHLPLSHHPEVGTGDTMPKSQEEMSPSTKKARFALHLADKTMKRIDPIDGSKTWEKAVGRIKWVMDTLGPIAEVRVMHF